MEPVGAIAIGVLLVLPCVWWLWKKQSSQTKLRRREGKPIPLLPERCTLLGGHIPWLVEQTEKANGVRLKPFFWGFMKHRMPVAGLQFGPSIGPLGRSSAMVSDSIVAEEILKSKDFGLAGNFATKIAHVVGGKSVISLDGAKWKHHRRLMQPIFRREQLRSALEVISRHTSMYLENLSTIANQSNESSTAGGYSLSKPADLVNVLTDLAMDIIAEVGYGYNLYEQPVEKQRAVRRALPAMMEHFSLIVFEPSLTLYRLLHPRKHQEFMNNRKFVQDELIYQMLKNRWTEMRGEEESPQDLLSLLVSAKDNESPTGEGFTEEEVVNEAMTMFVAGYETITASLSWILYYLAKHPDVQDRVYEEVSRVASEDALESLEGVGKLVFLSWVIKEVQRLEPVAAFVARGTLRDTTVQGYHFPAGTDVLIAVYNIHHSPDEWDEPEEFKPERWEKSDGGCKKSSGFSFLSFGAGARRCLGQPLAVPQMKLITAMFVSKFRLVLAGQCKPMMPFTYQPGRVLVHLERR